MKEEATDNSPGTPLTQISSNDIIPNGPNPALVRWIGLSAAVACAAAIGVFAFRQRPQLSLGNDVAELTAAAAAAPTTAPVPPPVLSVEPAVEVSATVTSPVVEAVASSAPTAPRKAKKGAVSSTKKVDCTPPYVVDENHIRRIKPQCL
jgi:hypothetical protein